MRINCKVFSWDKKGIENVSDLSFELTAKTPYGSDEDHSERSKIFLGGHPYTVNIPYKELQELFQHKNLLDNGERNYSGI